MVYKNDPANLKLAIRKYIIKMSLIYGFGIIFNFVLFYFYLPKIRPELEQIKYIYLIIFPSLTLFSAFLVYLNSKKIRNSYSNYSFEITNSKIIVIDDKIENEYNFYEIKKIEQIDKEQYVLYMKNKIRICTSIFLENKEKLHQELSKLFEIKNNTKKKVISFLSLFFVIGVFVSRFISNLWLYIFFALGFLVTSIITIYQIIFMENKLWIKIYSIALNIFLDICIIYSLSKVFNHLFV